MQARVAGERTGPKLAAPTIFFRLLRTLNVFSDSLPRTAVGNALARAPRASLLPVAVLRRLTLVGRLQVLAGLFQGALGVVVRL